jgi:DNA polymerase III subunit delta
MGDDDVELRRLAGDLAELVEDELRAFNVERLYAGEKGVSPAAIVESARMLPMMSDRRVVVVLRGERLLKPKRRGRAAEEEELGDEAEPSSDLDVLTEYVQRPEPSTTLAIVATDIDKSRRIWKSGFQKHATIVECWGLKSAREAKSFELPDAWRKSEQIIKAAVAEAGQQIEPAAARLLAQRAGFDVVTLRGDLERLLLFTIGRSKITVADVREVVSAETAQDDWAVTRAIERGNAAEALKQIGLALDSGGVPYMILGQLAWFVREKLADTRRIPAAIDALFRTDIDLKSSGGDPRVLLERLVIELAGLRPGSGT